MLGAIFFVNLIYLLDIFCIPLFAELGLEFNLSFHKIWSSFSNYINYLFEINRSFVALDFIMILKQAGTTAVMMAFTTNLIMVLMYPWILLR